MRGQAILPEQSGHTEHAAQTPSCQLVEAVRQALASSGHSWLRRVTVVRDDATVVLRGGVPSFYLKQLAQAAVLSVPGVEAVRNELQVEWTHPCG